MKFYQATNRLRPMTNNTWYDEQKRPVYKVSTPWKLTNRTSSIIKILPGADVQEIPVPLDPYEGQDPLEDDDEEDHKESGPSSSSAGERDRSVEPDDKMANWDEEGAAAAGEPSQQLSFSRPIGDNVMYLAQIDWRVIASSKIRFEDGKEIVAQSFFRKEGWGPYCRHRAFTAKDGREYKWLLKSFHSELIANDEKKTLIAKTKSRGLSIGKKRPGWLEIFPGGEHMMDEIFVMYVYIENIRRQKEAAAASS